METRGLDRLPEHMRDAVDRYVQRGIPGGSFLTAVLSNKLVDAYSRADDMNTDAMRAWASWLHNDAPGDCWGDAATVREWCAHGGLQGLQSREAAE